MVVIKVTKENAHKQSNNKIHNNNTTQQQFSGILVLLNWRDEPVRPICLLEVFCSIVEIPSVSVGEDIRWPNNNVCQEWRTVFI